MRVEAYNQVAQLYNREKTQKVQNTKRITAWHRFIRQTEQPGHPQQQRLRRAGIRLRSLP